MKWRENTRGGHSSSQAFIAVGTISSDDVICALHLQKPLHAFIQRLHENIHQTWHVSRVSLPCNWYVKRLTANHIMLGCGVCPACADLSFHALCQQEVNEVTYTCGQEVAHLPPSVQEKLADCAIIHVRNCHLKDGHVAALLSSFKKCQWYFLFLSSMDSAKM